MVEHWGKAVQGFQLAVQSSSGEYEAGEAIPLRLLLKNVGSGNSFIGSSRAMEYYRFEVTRVPNSPVPLTQYGVKESGPRDGSRNTVKLKPGEIDETKVQDLSRLFDMSLAGDYTIVVRRFVSVEGEDDVAREVVSNTLTIKVADR